ncbi:alpha-L-fucosidase [Tsukamurella tyrosinosolvens]|uniref:alpha-L-fucosidase n=1 Tax=Tsukamurella tyrosinosolvens TaxID=57704 RepID=UPI000DF71FA3|nr:alpha-L-fucosidase [Tsukamurella tyrosinosolvens]RDB47472.1 alpha-L-fucosidase [Tsukamurella tyrosinosolvens]
MSTKTAPPTEYEHLHRDVPQWFLDAKLGIFMHWGVYAVPAWAEPSGEFGTPDESPTFERHPYAEWYANSIRIEGSTAERHHRETYGDLPYESLLDRWQAESFDPDDIAELARATGARYFIPTAKHHDGVALWDAPGSSDFNTVRRGPKRDIVGELAHAVRRKGLRFGAYYSGGIDWHAVPAPPMIDKPDSPEDEVKGRSTGAEYAEYAYRHVVDLIDRYAPDVLWGDIDWPDEGKTPGPHSLIDLFDRFYAAAPDGVVNDRWGRTHWDFRTTEYQLDTHVPGEAWENCRGIGYSFGYNAQETAEHRISGPDLIRYFVDIVAGGGNLLLNIGPKADGTVPQEQREVLSALGGWNAVYGDAVFGTRPVAEDRAAPSDAPWVRWTAKDSRLFAVVDASGEVPLAVAAHTVVPDSAALMDGTAVPCVATESGMLVRLPDVPAIGPHVVVFDAVDG